MTRTLRHSFALAATVAVLQACTVQVPGGLLSGAAPKSTGATATGSNNGGTPNAAASSAPARTGSDEGGLVASGGGTFVSDPGGNQVNGAPGTSTDASVGQANPAHPQQPDQPPTQTQGNLKAGAIDDNANYQDYLTYLGQQQGQHALAYDVSERHIITVKDASGNAVPNVKVSVAAGENLVFTGKTYANGQLLFQPKAVPGADVGSRFFVTVGDDTTTATGFSRTTDGPWELTLKSAPAKPAAKVDLQIVLDTTGSMGGEIQKLQDTIKTISSRIQGLPQAPSVRMGLVAYKDQQGSEYLTKKQDFTGNIGDFSNFLDNLRASGGGDLPEDLETALNEGLTGESWDTAAPVRLSFVITDAPAHLDYPQAVPYTTSIGKAQAMGVKFFPVGCSGLPADGEYVLRQLAQATMGQYLFITRGGDEYSGGGEVSATVDKFQEGRLDDIMVDIVKKELDGLGNVPVPVATGLPVLVDDCPQCGAKQ